jgi:hypothetical protein
MSRLLWPDRTRELACSPKEYHPFTPVSVIPSTNVRWVRKKVMIIGATISVLAAIRYGYVSDSWKVERMDCSPSARGNWLSRLI